VSRNTRSFHPKSIKIGESSRNRRPLSSRNTNDRRSNIRLQGIRNRVLCGKHRGAHGLHRADIRCLSRRRQWLAGIRVPDRCCHRRSACCVSVMPSPEPRPNAWSEEVLVLTTGNPAETTGQDLGMHGAHFALASMLSKTEYEAERATSPRRRIYAWTTPAEANVSVRTVMSSSCPKRRAAAAIASADCMLIARVRSKPKSSP
jgi:hypothetical protein